MSRPKLPAVTPGCRQRLTAHYGDEVTSWLAAAPRLMTEAAQRWELTLGRYHDAGHASALCTAVDTTGRSVLLKAWPDPERFVREITALRLWAGGPVVEVINIAPDLAVACMALVGDRPGGSARSREDQPQVAAAIQRIHGTTIDTGVSDRFPRLSDYIRDEVRPCVTRRSRLATSRGLDLHLRLGMAALDEVSDSSKRVTLLHADLYRENILGDASGRPVLIDPLPMVGDAAFDWAFWIVYYTLGRGTAERLRLTAQYSGIGIDAVMPWCLVLCVHGLLYYREVGDSRAARMARLLLALARTQARSRDRQGWSCSSPVWTGISSGGDLTVPRHGDLVSVPVEESESDA